jgi:hypothetical protein
LTIERLGEHKNRVLSAADDWQAVEIAKSHSSERTDASVRWKEPVSRDTDEVVAEGNGSVQSRHDGVIKEVVSTDSKGAEEEDGQGVKEKLLRDADEVEHRDGSGAAAENNSISGMTTTGNLSSSLQKVKFIRDDQFIACHGPRTINILPLIIGKIS